MSAVLSPCFHNPDTPSCDPQAFKPKKKVDRKTPEGPTAYQILFDAVKAYFQNGCTNFDSKVRLTALPPIYFQHPGKLSVHVAAFEHLDKLTFLGHSMTIVGYEQKKDGSKNLICFDPMFHDAPNVLRLVDNDNFKLKAPEDMLRAYRRGVKYLKKYNEFEILRYVH